MKDKIKQVFDLISKIYISGDDVERMAMAKAILRELYKEGNNGRQGDTGSSTD